MKNWQTPNRLALSTILTTVLTAGCAQRETGKDAAETAVPPKPMLKLNMSSKPAAPAPDTETHHRFKFRELLSAETQRENRPASPEGKQANGPWGGYDPQRLARAAQPHEWWPVDGPESGFQVHLRTQWRAGKLIVDIVAVGPVVNINRFLAGIASINVIITDVAGNQMAAWTLSPQDFHWATNDGANGQLFYHTEVDYQLEYYEQFQNWNFLWTNR